MIGLRVDNLIDNKEKQISLFEDIEKNEKQNKLDIIVDSINEKYGINSVTRAGKLNIEKIVKMKK